MNVVVQKPSVNRRTGAVRYSAIEDTTSENGHFANLIAENLDGTLRVRYADGHFANVPPTSVRSARISQVRLPGEVRVLGGPVAVALPCAAAPQRDRALPEAVAGLEPELVIEKQLHDARRPAVAEYCTGDLLA